MELNKYSRFQKINFLFLILLGYVVILHFIEDVVIKRSFSYFIINEDYQNVVYLILILIFFIANIVKERRFLVLGQIALLQLLSFFIIATEGVNSTGTSLYLIICFYIWREGFIERKTGLKVLFLLLSYLLGIGLFIAFYTENDTTEVTGAIVLGFTTLFLLWVIFEEDLRNALKKIEQDRVYTDMGMNSSLLLHNVKNDIGMLENYLYLMEEDGDSSHYLDELKKSMEMIQNKISFIKQNVTLSQQTEPEIIFSSTVIQSVTELYLINKKIQENVEFLLKLHNPDLRICTIPFELRDSLINLINNAVEACSSRKSGHKRGQIILSQYSEKGRVVISIKDNGKGLKDCRGIHCSSPTCLFCNIFESGKTDKRKGSGQGLLYVMHYMNKMRGDISFYNVPDGGTEVKLYFTPLPDEQL